MKRGDRAIVKHGRYAGRQGKVLCIFRGLATLLQPDSVAIQVEVKDVAQVETAAAD